MSQNGSQHFQNHVLSPSAIQDVNHHPLTPPLTASTVQQSQESVTPIQNSGIHLVSSQSVYSVTSASNQSDISTNTEETTTDELFDKIEHLIRDYMQRPLRFYLHCRILRWTTEQYPSRRFSAIVVINPPTDIHG